MSRIPQIPKQSRCLVDLTAFLSRLAYRPGPRGINSYQIKSAKTGEPTWGVMGALLQFQTLALAEPKEVIALADSSQNGFRQEILPTYKQKSGSDYIHTQMKRLASTLPLLGVSVYGANNEYPGMEAEDLIAKLALETEEPLIIVGFDKDLLQLVSDKVSCWNPFTKQVINRENISRHLKEKFLPKYTGELVPNDLAVILAITGDESDDVNSIGGIGPVKLAEYYAKLPPGLHTPAEKIEALAKISLETPNAKANWLLARTNLAVVNLDTLHQRKPKVELKPAPEPNKEGFRAVLEELTINSFLKDYDQWFKPFERTVLQPELG